MHRTQHFHLDKYAYDKIQFLISQVQFESFICVCALSFVVISCRRTRGFTTIAATILL